MNKFTLIIAKALLAVVISTSGHAQSAREVKEPAEKSKIETFSLKTGSLIKKEFTTIGSVKRIEVKKLVLTDILSNSTLSGVKMETAISKTYGTSTTSCFLDSDEVDAFIKSGKYLLSPPANTANNYVELQFTSRGGFQAGAYLDKAGSWKYFIKLERFDSDSYVFLDRDDFERLSELVGRSK